MDYNSPLIKEQLRQYCYAVSVSPILENVISSIGDIQELNHGEELYTK
jgi:hypothetical protein